MVNGEYPNVCPSTIAGSASNLNTTYKFERIDTVDSHVTTVSIPIRDRVVGQTTIQAKAWLVGRTLIMNMSEQVFSGPRIKVMMRFRIRRNDPDGKRRTPVDRGYTSPDYTNFWSLNSIPNPDEKNVALNYDDRRYSVVMKFKWVIEGYERFGPFDGPSYIASNIVCKVWRANSNPECQFIY